MLGSGVGVGEWWKISDGVLNGWGNGGHVPWIFHYILDIFLHFFLNEMELGTGMVIWTRNEWMMGKWFDEVQGP